MRDASTYIMEQELELDPVTFAPTLALKYGSLLSEPSSDTLRVKLHPSCIAVPDESLDETEWADDDDGGYARRLRHKFGAAIVDDEDEGVAAAAEAWEGDWGGARLVVV